MDSKMLMDVAQIIGSSIVEHNLPTFGWVGMNGVSCVILPYILWRLQMKIRHAVISTAILLFLANLMYRYFIAA